MMKEAKLTREQHIAECVRCNTVDLERCQSELRELEEDCRTLGHPCDWSPEDMGDRLSGEVLLCAEKHYEKVIVLREKALADAPESYNQYWEYYNSNYEVVPGSA
jgi:hypothetical protein